MIKTAIIVVALLSSVSAMAQDVDVWGTVMTRSYHANREKAYNEDNHGIGADFVVGPHVISVGTFKNSYYRYSTVVGYSWLPLRIGDYASVGVQVGAVTGYRRAVVPYGLFVVDFKLTDRTGLNILTVPPHKSGGPSGVVSAQLKYKFN